MNLVDQFMAARRAGTPLIAIKTLDPEATILKLMAGMRKLPAETPVLQFDLVRGLLSRNDIGEETRVALRQTAPDTTNPVEMLVQALAINFQETAQFPTNPVLFILNAHHHLDLSYSDRPVFIQALWNLRIPYRDSLRSIVLLAPDFNFPPELQHDILVLDEPLPTDVEISNIISETASAFGTTLTKEVHALSVNALRGLQPFETEQATAMCLDKKGIDVPGLWGRKKQMITETKGLSVWVGGNKFNGLGGINEIKTRFSRIIHGKRPLNLVLWIDEIEKGGLGAGAHSSSTETDQLAIILSWMQDTDQTGAILFGVPGSGKSEFAKALANESGCITIKLDLGGARGEGLVGQAENDIRQAFKIIDAVGGRGGVFVIATSNDASIIKPELKRRFKKGIWFFDISDDAEKTAIAQIYKNKYESRLEMGDWESVSSKNWTGAEIATCFETAWEESISLTEAARGIIPVAVSDKAAIDRMRQEAEGRYNSASYSGAYRIPAQTTAVSTRRKFGQGGQE